MPTHFPVPLPAFAWLAPMSGVTDAPFRRQVSAFGARAVVSEMVAGDTFSMGHADMVRRTYRHSGEGLWIVQLAARRPEDMFAGACLLADAGVDIIDINMGCPAKRVTGGQSGSALMRDLDLAGAIIDAAIAGAGGRPVTLKMRLGWDDNSLNAPELAALGESKGLAWLTVHGRTRSMFYKGHADWQRIRDTVDRVALPVIANGDIATIADAEDSLSQSGADAVMIGRAAVGRPWCVAEIEAHLRGEPFVAPTLEAQFESLAEQISDSVELYGPVIGVRTVRKHVAGAIDHLNSPMGTEDRRILRARLCQIDAADELVSALRRVYFQPFEAIAA